MARHVFFSFHYQRDIMRVSQVRNSWVTQDQTTAGFWDAASWESVKRGGDVAIKRWIEEQLNGTSVTVVLIGAETSSRKYVNYEIERSINLGKGLLGVRIHNLRDPKTGTDVPGPNPFDNITVIDNGGIRRSASQIYRTYDWKNDDGYNNFGSWVESAARAAGK